MSWARMGPECDDRMRCAPVVTFSARVRGRGPTPAHRLFGIASGLLVAVCSCEGNSATSKRLPHSQVVPDPDLAGMELRVTRLLQRSRLAVMSEPESAKAWLEYGMALDTHDLKSDAETCYRRAHALSPDGFRPLYHLAYILDYRGGRAEEAIRLYRLATKLRPRYSAVFFRLGYQLSSVGRLTEARDALERSLELDPVHVVAHRTLGQVLIQLGDTLAAIHHLERAAELGPDDSGVYAALAQAYTHLGDQESARQAADQSRGCEPTLRVRDPVRAAVGAKGVNAAACNKRAKRMMRDGDFAGAIENLKNVEQVRPKDPYVQNRMGASYLRLDQRDLALKHFLQAANLKDDLEGVHIKLGTLYLGGGQLDEAIHHFRRAQNYEPDNPALGSRLATAVGMSGDSEGALIEFQRAASLGPLDAGTYLNWGNTLVEIGDLEQAVEQYNQALRLKPDYAEAHYSLGLVLERLERPGEAIAHYKQAVSTEPQHPAARRLAQLESAGP